MMNNNLIIEIPNITTIVLQNCEQRLMPSERYIDFVYNINQKMQIIGDVSKKKFLSEITFFDAEINKNIWIGTIVNVACIVELTENFIVNDQKIALSRIPVQNSVRAFDKNGNILQISHTGNEILLGQAISNDEKITIKYRPWISMYIRNFVTKCKNFGFDVEQKIILEEV